MGLVGREGPEKVTVDQIAAAAGVAKGTVYYQFGSKHDLVDSLLEHGFALMRAALAEHADEADPLRALELMVGSALDFLGEYSGYAQLWISELWRPTSPWREQLLGMRGELVALVAAALRRIEAEQPIEPAELEALAVALLGATYVSGMDAHLSGPARDRAARVAAVMTAVRGYAAR